MLIRLTLTAAAIMLAQQTLANDGPLAFIPITYANNYQHGIDIFDYWKSEKLDGIRAIWTGKQLVTRNGNPISAPLGLPSRYPLIHSKVNCGQGAAISHWYSKRF